MLGKLYYTGRPKDDSRKDAKHAKSENITDMFFLCALGVLAR